VTTTHAVELDGVSRRFGGVPALDGVSLRIPKGSLTGLIGRNGAGKTTLLSILGTLDEDFTGSARVCGTDVRQSPRDVRRRIGFVADETRATPHLTVERYLFFFARAYGLVGDEAYTAIERTLARVGLEDARSLPSTGLSRGMSQRLALARALLHNPMLLLLDEPASGLDPRARIALKQTLKSLCEEGHTIIVSSHILTELGDLVDRLVVIDRGRIVAEGPIETLYAGARGGSALQRVVVELEVAASEAAAALADVQGVTDIVVDGAVVSFSAGGRADVARAVRALVTGGHDVVRVSPERDNLEALFLTLTSTEEA
jgi:ABC-2 type transport system ATP-binding protein